MDLQDIKSLFELIDQDIEVVSKSIQSLKRDEQFLEAATGAWTSSIGMNRSMEPNDKADSS